MPDIPLGSQVFDIVFHPRHSVVYTALLSGHVNAFAYDDQGTHHSTFSLKPAKGSCRGLTISEDGAQLWAVGKGKGLHTIDTTAGKLIGSRASAHDAAINRVKYIMSNFIATGDDDGTIKLWDTRKQDCVRTYTHHFDFISDFLWLEDKKHLVATSGDGTLSVMDVRSKKMEPHAHSENQEDELLSIVTIKNGTKAVVGTQLGVLSIFNREKGWGDCVDRVLGHPHSIDALCPIPSYYPSSNNTILTGSSDGLLRAVQLLPTKLLGVVADHGDFPIERIAVDRAGEGRWVGSVGHDEILHLTDLRDIFEDEDAAEPVGAGNAVDEDIESRKEDAATSNEGRATNEGEEYFNASKRGRHLSNQEGDAEEQASGDSDVQRPKKNEKDPMKASKKGKGKNQVDADPSFFAGLY